MLHAMWTVLLALAPWLLLGSVIAGLLHFALPRDFIRRQLTGRWAVLKAVALGVPLPLCSCGVIPTGLGLKKDGASDGAAVGFLISTPQTGVDSILVSSSFLGWPFAIFKVVAALVTGLAGGLLTDATSRTTAVEPASDDPVASRDSRGFKASVDYAVEILRMIWRWIVLGVVVSAAIETLVPEGFFAGLADHGALVPVLAALAVSLPLYVCATASVPIAAALVAGGMPAGAALVFLMAGPATNVATIGAIYRGLGLRSLAVYLGTIITGSVGAGMLFDSVLAGGSASASHVHGEDAWWAVASAALLLGLLGWFALDDLRKLAARLGRRGGGTRIELDVAGMKCGGCASKLERTLRGEQGVTDVAVSVDPGRAVIHGSAGENRLRELIEAAGFTVVDA